MKRVDGPLILQRGLGRAYGHLCGVGQSCGASRPVASPGLGGRTASSELYGRGVGTVDNGVSDVE